MYSQVAADGAARAQAEAAVQRQEALASLEVARAELDKVQQQLALAQSAADKKGQEVRELNHMLKAWEAMRLGKDAQVRRSKSKLRTLNALLDQEGPAPPGAQSGLSKPSSM
jgi:chromosome segregation ATPase